MKDQVSISIPMPLLLSIEDVGWWSGINGSKFNQPYRTGMQRDHVPLDYMAITTLGKRLDMRVLSGLVLCEWDKLGILRKVPSTTWMGEKWHVSGNNNEQKEEAAWILKNGKKHVEIALHGVGHEFWENGKMERTEFHNEACEMREPDKIKKHLTCFFELMDQYGLNSYPRVFIPPALKHSFGNQDKGFQKIISDFGIRYVTLVFNRAKMYARPQTDKIAWENNVLLVERGESDVEWDTVACDPIFKFDRPIMALHWANILHPDPEKNLMVVEKWVNYIKKQNEKKGFLLAKDTKSCFTQYLHKIMSKVKKNNEEFLIDLNWIKSVPQTLLGKSIFLKVDAPPGIKLKISGTKRQPSLRPAEKPFLKLDIPKETKIHIKPIK